ncbi:related to 3-hydroxybutyryl-CoA dehydrogenase [Fusarium torulosum]|uniref:Related to 3-hydroxybutyryl-CoA dehydrogenase n=1 Tax=Fusarium torulosum TaxID=33205 RepID=A0AAE8MBH2_9HYPO|nr:related to 3-hydroxybutyryl-CoA dehydrogenase [Fusarium torulosum]
MSSFTLPSTEGRTVAVLGGGVLGRRIACGWAASGYDVIIRDPSPEQRTAAVEYCNTSMSNYSDSPTRGSVKAVEDLSEAVAKAWLVIEAVPEKLPLKISTFADLERLTAEDTILASNSSSYKSREMLGDLKPETRRRVLNMHYYMPPEYRSVELMTDGETHEDIFPFLAEKLEEIKFHPYVARKESTGFIYNRLWAAIKREVLTILAEGVSTPEEIEKLWKEMWYAKEKGPVAMMDAVGLDTVSFIEQHYIAERGLPNTPVDFLQKFIDEGKLGDKSKKGGLLPPKQQTKSESETKLYFLDIGLSGNSTAGGSILVGTNDAKPLTTLVSHQSMPDGIDISNTAKKLFWTSMGKKASQDDGAVLSCNLDGSDVQEVIPRGSVHTPKQLTVDEKNSKLYFSDREGLRVMRSNFDGSDLEILVQTGDYQNEQQKSDPTRWCVGVTVSPSTGKFYWTQKGPSKGDKGRIFRANIDFKSGEDAKSRTDIELLFQGLPEPIDLEMDEAENTLYWTDRGELPKGNTINRAKLDTLVICDGASQPGQDYEIVSQGLHEAIGIKLDSKNRRIFATDLGGAVYQLDMDGGNKKKVYEGSGNYVGITLAYN